MMAFVSRTEEGLLPSVMEPKPDSRSFTLHGSRYSPVMHLMCSLTCASCVGTRPDGLKAVHGEICDCVFDDENEIIITELGLLCNDFYVKPSQLKVPQN